MSVGQQVEAKIIDLRPDEEASYAVCEAIAGSARERTRRNRV